jgi:hypothetical protein
MIEVDHIIFRRKGNRKSWVAVGYQLSDREREGKRRARIIWVVGRCTKGMEETKKGGRKGLGDYGMER